MKRRDVILAGGAAGLVLAGGASASLRLHRAPRQTPFLTEEHLSGLGQTQWSQDSVLFVGNSMFMRHDVVGRVAAMAAEEGVAIDTALAAADGARLVETWRLGAFRALLEATPWGAVVLLDFTKTPLRAVDRWGSAFAIGRIVSAVRPAPVLLCPPFPAAPGNGVYRDAGLMTRTPGSPEEYAALAMKHYSDVGERYGLPVIPVPDRWVEADNAGFYAEDGHHASAEGSEFMAGVIWQALREVVVRRDG